MKRTGPKIAAAIIALVSAALLYVALTDRRFSATSTVRTTDTVPSTDGSSKSAIERVNLNEITLGNFGRKMPPADTTISTVDNDQASGDPLVLQTGVIGLVPDRESIVAIDALPFTDSQARRAYRDAQNRTVRSVPPQSPVVTPRSKVRTAGAGTLGRVSVLTLGLKTDPTGERKLPEITKTQVRKYFATHRLSVQPVVYYDKQGRLFFGTDCQTAFYQPARPGITVEAEPMIDTAIGRFRALGVLRGHPDRLTRAALASSTDPATTPATARTLAMAFNYEVTDTALKIASVGKRLVTELLLVHLPPDATPTELNLRVFITSDGRRELNRLILSKDDLDGPRPTIEATVRFDSMRLLGMYPADPVVTGIDYRTDGSLSLERINQLVSQGDGAITVADILDRFGDFVVR